MDSRKSLLRNRAKNSRLSMKPQSAERLSEQIIGRLTDRIYLGGIESIHIYRPFKKYCEINTNQLFNIIWRDYPKLKTASWRRTNNTWVSWWISSYGWREPVEKGFQFDIIVLPLFVFNKQNHRIGYGGGFYDRFLVTQEDTMTIGLCYESGLSEDFKEEPHDKQLNIIITENNIYTKT